MSKPKNIFQVNYFYFDKYNNEKLIQKRKPVPPNITCMMYIRKNVRYKSVIRIVILLCRLQRKSAFSSTYHEAWALLCSNLLLFRNMKMQDPKNSAFTMNVVVIVKNTKTLLFFCLYEEGKCVICNDKWNLSCKLKKYILLVYPDQKNQK